MNIGDFDLDPMAAPSAGLLRFEQAPDELPFPSGARAVIREALIPFIVWADVPVRVLKARQLGRMEAFVLEAGLTLGRFTLAELEDATSVPAKVIASSASKLLAHRTLVELGGGAYAVNEEEATRIVATRNIREVHAQTMTFAYFPRQDEVTADPRVTTQLTQIHKRLRAPRQAPLPPALDRAASVGDFLAGRIAEQRVSGATDEILGLNTWAKPPRWPELSPCYFGRGHVRGEGLEAVAELDVWGKERKNSRSQQYVREPLQLGSSATLLREWIALNDQFATAFAGSAKGLPPFFAARMERFAPGQWRVGVSGEDALALATDRWLTDPLPISICSPTAKVDVRLSLEPLSPEGAALFALDSMAQRTASLDRPFSATDFAEQAKSASERFPLAAAGQLSRRRVEERLWAMKRFKTLYALRAREDFAYG